MKKLVFLSLILCLCPLSFGQNYEQQGDDLFAQAQYGQAIKKYNAAIELSGSSTTLENKVSRATSCQSILFQAQKAEQNYNWSQAVSSYKKLYDLHPLSTYKTKINSNNQKIIAQEQARKEAAEKAKREAEEAEKQRQEQIKQREEAAESRRRQEEAARAEKIRKEQEEANKRNVTFSFITPSSNIRVIQCDAKGSSIKEGSEHTTFRVPRNNSYRFQFACSQYKTLDTTLYIGNSDKCFTIKLRPLLEHKNTDISISDLIVYPIGMKRISWTDPKSTIKKRIMELYPNLSGNNDCLLGTVFGPTYYGQNLSEIWINMDDNKYSIHYSFSVDSKAKELWAKQLRKDLSISCGFQMSEMSNSLESYCYKATIYKGICFSSIVIGRDGTLMELRINIDRDKCTKSTMEQTNTSPQGLSSQSSYQSSRESYTTTYTSTHSNSSSTNLGYSTTGGYTKLKDCICGKYMEITEVKILKNNLPSKKAEVKFTYKTRELLPITYVIVVKKGDVGCKKFEFTGGAITSAIPEWIDCKEYSDCYVFKISGFCKIEKNWDYELGDVVLFKQK